MQTLSEIIASHPDATDAQAKAIHDAQPPEPKASSPATYVTYLSIGEDARFGMNVAGTIRANLAEWLASPTDLSTLNPALPNKGALQSIDERLAGGKGVDVSSPNARALLGLFITGVPGVVDPVLSAEQSADILSIGWNIVTPVLLADVTAERARLTRLAAVTAIRNDLATYANEILNPAEADPALPLVTPQTYFGGDV